MENFQLERYLGRWYEMQRDKKIRFEKGEYATADYTLNKKGISVRNTEYRLNKKKIMRSKKMWGKCDIPTRGVCKITSSKLLPWANYWVLDTDYDEFAVVYSKVTGFWKHFVDMEFVWVLTRAPLEQKTSEWQAIKAKTDSIIGKKLPLYDLDRLRVTV